MTVTQQHIMRGTCYIMPISEGLDVLPAIFRSGDFKKLNIVEAYVKVSDFRQDVNNVIFRVSSDT